MSYTRISSTILVCICFAALTQPVWGQTGTQRPNRGVPGHLDPLTGTFKPSPTVVEENPDIALAALTTFGGTFTFKFTITIKSTNLPTTDSIACTATADVTDSNPTTFALLGFYEEEASVAAARSGSTATCTVNIPYSWNLGFASSDTVNLNYVISVPGFFIVGTTTNALPNRLSSHTLPSMKVPANGAITTITISATI